MEKLIKKAMIDKGRTDFSAYLSEIIGCSIVWASKKLKNGNFTASELSTIANALDIDSAKLGKAIKECEG